MSTPRCSEAEGGRVLFWCPGCEEGHAITVGTWTWNGTINMPTFSPSVLVRGNQWPRDEFPSYYRPQHASVAPGADTVCHSFVTDRRIQFLADCTHTLAGQTVDLPAWPPASQERP
ncbi:DUF6527 family protein [Pimelobacter simplex]|uniref:DUF6527 family protein n=1 Tax=Nocardioides simplex TaxID=2045 RepID=UPI00214F7D21|nr:DUF6527 family protein [Pimelobacter simplex]UUW87391.1 DUF6527 family protein [Pimelobacter simplex]UUW96896.1 DUF6527 family protein [Pimelobacter simplex]